MPHRVLVVDDQPLLTELLGLLIDLDERFELAGTAAHGFEALAAVRSDPPDAIVCDVNMPVLDGLGALPGLRASCPAATILMYTSDPAGAGDAVTLGADAVVDKATDPATLLDRLAQMRERTGEERAHAQVGCGPAPTTVVVAATDRQRAQRN